MSCRRVESPPPPCRPASTPSAEEVRASFHAAVAEQLARLDNAHGGADGVRQTLSQKAGGARLDGMDTCALLSTVAEVFNVEVHVSALVGGSSLQDGARILPASVSTPRGSRPDASRKVFLVQHGVPPTAWSSHRWM